ncbi:MAG: hypothetical protein AB1Y26_11845 [Cycloclasticus sp.]
MLPRHAAGSFELKEGTGPITGMQSCGEFLEMYKVDKTFRVKSPESIDPEETNPNAMWITSPTDKDQGVSQLDFPIAIFQVKILVMQQQFFAA